MDISKFLAKVIGIYLIIVSVAMLFNTAQFINYVNGLIQNSSLMFVTAFFSLIIGILIVVGHNVWRLNWRVVITLIGWITLLKAASIIFYPQFIDNATLAFVQNPTFAYISGIIDFIIGILLCYFGFRKN